MGLRGGTRAGTEGQKYGQKGDRSQDFLFHSKLTFSLRAAKAFEPFATT